MFRIDHQILDCAVYIYPSRASAERGDDVGGSGFLVNIKNEAHNHIYAVTNRHVARQRVGKSTIDATSVIRLNRLDGRPEYFEVEPHEWTGLLNHDLVAVRLSLDRNEHDYATVPIEIFVGRAEIDRFGIGVGDDVFMVGRFVDDKGKQTNRPMARFGNLMIRPESPMMVRDGDSGVSQESILIELRSVVGFSGSPVFVRFITNWGLEENKGYPRADYGTKTLLLGIFWGHFPQTLVTAERKEVEISAGIGCVVPAWRLRELLMTQKLVDQRNQIEDLEQRKSLRRNSAVQTTSAEPASSSSVDDATASETPGDYPIH